MLLARWPAFELHKERVFVPGTHAEFFTGEGLGEELTLRLHTYNFFSILRTVVKLYHIYNSNITLFATACILYTYEHKYIFYDSFILNHKIYSWFVGGCSLAAPSIGCAPGLFRRFRQRCCFDLQCDEHIPVTLNMTKTFFRNVRKKQLRYVL